jgi:AAA+ superfamily predicted ATPase
LLKQNKETLEVAVASQEKEDEVVSDEEVEEIIGRGDKKKRCTIGTSFLNLTPYICHYFIIIKRKFG